VKRSREKKLKILLIIYLIVVLFLMKIFYIKQEHISDIDDLILIGREIEIPKI
jgi:hypothetical protein